MYRLLLFLLLVPSLAHADNWPNWRGPNGNGTAEGEGYLHTWDLKKDVLWKVALPGVGGSTPAVWGEHVFVTSPSGSSQNEKNVVHCFDINGKEKWKRVLGKERPGKHKKGSGSNPSPLTDGRFVYCYFKSGELICLDFEGKTVWEKNLQEEYGEDTLWWDLGTSPVLIDNALVVACVQSGPSYLVAFDKATGDVLWKQDRLLKAPEEANQTYSTPAVVGSGADQKLVMLGADHVTCHSAKDGSELWRIGGMNPKNDKYFRSISSPVVSGKMVIAPYARGNTLTAIRMGGTGDVTKSHIAWSNEGHSSDVPTPAVLGDRVFVLADKGSIAALRVSDGSEIWKGRLPKNRNAYSASPIVADGRLYVVREDGKTFVLSLDRFEILSENELDDRVVASPVFTDGKILFRGAESLQCVGAR